VHSGFVEQELDDQPGKPVNSDPDSAIADNPTRFRIILSSPGHTQLQMRAAWQFGHGGASGGASLVIATEAPYW